MKSGRNGSSPAGASTARAGSGVTGPGIPSVRGAVAPRPRRWTITRRSRSCRRAPLHQAPLPRTASGSRRSAGRHKATVLGWQHSTNTFSCQASVCTSLRSCPKSGFSLACSALTPLPPPLPILGEGGEAKDLQNTCLFTFNRREWGGIQPSSRPCRRSPLPGLTATPPPVAILAGRGERH